VGDFNEVLLGCEKEGGQPKVQSCMNRFREALDDCALSDLGFVHLLVILSLGGTIVTTHNSTDYIRERLDRAVADEACCSRF
jgi:hypothetical protein